MIAIKTSSLQIGYSLRKGQKKVVSSNLNLELENGRLCCLLGPNGSGKSTLMKTLCGFIKPLRGEIEICGKSLHSYSQAEIATMVGVVLTEKITGSGLNIFDLVSLGRYPYTGYFGKLDENDIDVINRAIAACGYRGDISNYVSELSDGERQKIMIAKTLAQECPIIILDEPTAFLDITSKIEIMELLASLAHDQEKTVLISTHDLDTALRTADELWIEDESNGTIVCGSPEDLGNTDIFERIFGSKAAKIVYSAIGK